MSPHQQNRSTATTSKGFTLLELLVALVLTSIIVIYLTQLYKMTGHAATTIKSAGSDWNAEHFIRQQLWQQLPEFNTALLQFKGEKNSLQFASRYSAAYGDSGSYVKAVYRYDSNKQTLTYEEQPYVNWWTTEGREKIKSHSQRQQQNQIQTVFKQVSNLQFSYSYRGTDGTIKWKEMWDNPKLPELIKLDYRRGGQLQTLIFDHRVSSFSTVSGF